MCLQNFKGKISMETNATVSQAKLDLIRKIITARLSKAELQAVTVKAQELIDKRP
jgi:hypothetical protein